MNSQIKAVLFDFGGVISASPFEMFADYEQANSLPNGFLRNLNATNPDRNAWAGLERGELSIDAFAERFESEAREAGGSVNARELLSRLQGGIRPEMVEAIRLCREHYKTALLTNNFKMDDRDERVAGVLPLFDVVVESSTAGCRKPEERFYRTALELLGISASEAVFLDDLGINLKPARAMGMTTIKVADAAQALAQLQSVLELDLLP